MSLACRDMSINPCRYPESSGSVRRVLRCLRIAADRRFKFHERRQLFIRTHNEPLSIAAIHVSNKDWAETSTQTLKFPCYELLQVSKKQNDVESERRDTEHNERLVIRFAPSECAEE
jgi:hypothetical protein